MVIKCIRCGSSNWRQLHRSAIEPAEDTFLCKECGNSFKRYDRTVSLSEADRCPAMQVIKPSDT